jgi:alkanesulfonate monooxygenase SsuD/methylene tetrahydromethanopterin reductase-like flavin-dependent oxidoreductase (luciferase family)
MILTASFGGDGTPPTVTLPFYRSVVAACATAGVDAALFVRPAAAAATTASPGIASPGIDAQVLIAALASVPVGIGLGASVPIDFTEPFHLARAFAAIDRLTRGRSAVVVDLAAGTELAASCGHRERPTGPCSRCERAVELFEVAGKLWDSWQDDALLVDRAAGLFADPDKVHRINHDGPYFTVRGPLNAPRPIQGWPVIVMPVVSATSRELAAQIADVALIRCATQAAAQSACNEIRETVAVHGRRLQAVRILADLVPILGQSPTAARRREAAFGEAPGDAPGGPLRFVGTPAQLAALMRDWHAVGACDGFNLLPRNTPEDFALLAECIVALGRTAVADGATLRTRLELPRPVSRYAA